MANITVLERLHAPKAFGEEVVGSTPIFSTKPDDMRFFFMYWVYIIYSDKLDRYYVGYSSDLEKRLQEHNTGISEYTSKATDWSYCYKASFSSREEAHKEELRIKKKKSRKYIEWLISQS